MAKACLKTDKQIFKNLSALTLNNSALLSQERKFPWKIFSVSVLQGLYKTMATFTRVWPFLKGFPSEVFYKFCSLKYFLKEVINENFIPLCQKYLQTLACGKLRSIYLWSPYGQVDTGFKCIYNFSPMKSQVISFYKINPSIYSNAHEGVLKVPTDFKQKKLPLWASKTSILRLWNNGLES